jgi:hypothetical protein
MTPPAGPTTDGRILWGGWDALYRFGVGFDS